jgi:micrococcal nuclease
VKTGLLVAAMALAVQGASAASFAGVVTRVSDGDTVWVQRLDRPGRPLKLRLRGIDAPEICQAGGEASRDALALRVLRREVNVDTAARDDYGRWLSTLAVDGDDVAASMVADGQAWNSRWRGAPGPYAREEARARAARRGVFADPAALEPRQFRKLHGPCD